MEYTFVYSGEWEGFKRFRKLSNLLKLIRQIPDHELKNTRVFRKKDEFVYVGAYYVTKSGLLSVKF